MKADEQGCRAFLSIFPLHGPVICDSTHQITMSFQVHHHPFALVYDTSNKLIRKSVVQKKDDLLSLLGDMSKPQATNAC
jgi:hypothetical protein